MTFSEDVLRNKGECSKVPMVSFTPQHPSLKGNDRYVVWRWSLPFTPAFVGFCSPFPHPPLPVAKWTVVKYAPYGYPTSLELIALKGLLHVRVSHDFELSHLPDFEDWRPWIISSGDNL